MTQLYTILLFILTGFILGFIFDFFKIIRKSFTISDRHVIIEDFLFGIIASILLIVIIFVINKGNIRWYTFMFILTGLVLYFLTISKLVIKVNVSIIISLKKIFSYIFKIILKPIKLIMTFINKIFRNYFTFIVINVKKIKKIIKK